MSGKQSPKKTIRNQAYQFDLDSLLPQARLNNLAACEILPSYLVNILN